MFFLRIVFILLITISAQAADKYCSSVGTYYCGIKVADPATHEYCTTVPLDAKFDGVNYMSSNFLTFLSNDPSWTYIDWEFMGCDDYYLSGKDRLHGVSAICNVRHRWFNPNASPYQYLDQGATSKQYNCKACPAGTTWSSDVGRCVVEPKKNWGTPACNNKAGNPITLSSGNKFQHEIDYNPQGIMPLKIERFYNSVLEKWHFSGRTALKGFYPSAYSNLGYLWAREDGKDFVFERLSGIWQVRDYPGVSLVQVGNEWHISENPSVTYVFDNLLAFKRKVHQSGVTHTYDSGVADQLTVTHSNGGVMTYRYDVLGRVERIEVVDSQNNAVDFNYTYADKILTEVSQETAGSVVSTRTFHYEDSRHPTALTGITDEQGVRFATWSYDDIGRAISSEHFDGAEKVQLTFNQDNTTTVTNALGKDTTYHFDSINGADKVVLVEGHQSDNCAAANQNYTYFPESHLLAGMKETQTDWNGVVTRFEYNARGLETKRTEAEGTPEERVTITEWHTGFSLPTRVISDNNETLYSYDSNGRLLSQTTSPSAP